MTSPKELKEVLTIFPADSEGREDRVPLKYASLFFLVDFKIKHGGSVFLEKDDLGLREGDGKDGLELTVAPGGGNDFVIGIEAMRIIESHGLNSFKKIKKYQTDVRK